MIRGSRLGMQVAIAAMGLDMAMDLDSRRRPRPFREMTAEEAAGLRRRQELDDVNRTIEWCDELHRRQVRAAEAEQAWRELQAARRRAKLASPKYQAAEAKRERKRLRNVAQAAAPKGDGHE